ncbi:hypothetical protein GC177_04595 [bacterium]|nr:hypothetical protein [bacterium]
MAQLPDQIFEQLEAFIANKSQQNSHAFDVTLENGQQITIQAQRGAGSINLLGSGKGGTSQDVVRDVLLDIVAYYKDAKNKHATLLANGNVLAVDLEPYQDLIRQDNRIQFDEQSLQEAQQHPQPAMQFDPAQAQRLASATAAVIQSIGTFPLPEKPRQIINATAAMIEAGGQAIPVFAEFAKLISPSTYRSQSNASVSSTPEENSTAEVTPSASTNPMVDHPQPAPKHEDAFASLANEYRALVQDIERSPRQPGTVARFEELNDRMDSLIDQVNLDDAPVTEALQQAVGGIQNVQHGIAQFIYDQGRALIDGKLPPAPSPLDAAIKAMADIAEMPWFKNHSDRFMIKGEGTNAVIHIGSAFAALNNNHDLATTVNGRAAIRGMYEVAERAFLKGVISQEAFAPINAYATEAHLRDLPNRPSIPRPMQQAMDETRKRESSLSFTADDKDTLNRMADMLQEVADKGDFRGRGSNDRNSLKQAASDLRALADNPDIKTFRDAMKEADKHSVKIRGVHSSYNLIEFAAGTSRMLKDIGRASYEDTVISERFISQHEGQMKPAEVHKNRLFNAGLVMSHVQDSLDNNTKIYRFSQTHSDMIRETSKILAEDGVTNGFRVVWSSDAAKQLGSLIDSSVRGFFGGEGKDTYATLALDPTSSEAKHLCEQLLNAENGVKKGLLKRVTEVDLTEGKGKAILSALGIENCRSAVLKKEGGHYHIEVKLTRQHFNEMHENIKHGAHRGEDHEGRHDKALGAAGAIGRGIKNFLHDLTGAKDWVGGGIGGGVIGGTAAGGLSTSTALLGASAGVPPIAIGAGLGAIATSFYGFIRKMTGGRDVDTEHEYDQKEALTQLKDNALIGQANAENTNVGMSKDVKTLESALLEVTKGQGHAVGGA